MLCGRAIPILLLVIAPVTKAANLCFLPGGKQVADVPCDLKAQVSMCCGSVAACLSNGLCKDEKTTNTSGVAYARGTCTDPTWQSPICPQHCQLNQDTPRNSSAFDFRLNGVQMWQCDAQGYGSPANYCCESTAEKTRCCATQSALFKLAAATPGNALAIQTFLPPGPTASTTQASASPTSAPDSNLPTSTGGLSAPVSGPVGVNNGSNGPLDRNGLIAVGMGAGLGGAAIASMVVMLLVRRMRRREQSTQGSVISHGDYYQGPRNGSQGSDVSKWHTLTRYDTAELDHNAGPGRYWAAAEGKDVVMDPYKTPTTVIPSRMDTPNESPVMGRPSPTGQVGVGLGLDKRPLPPPPASADPNQAPGRKRSIYEMPGW